MKKIWFFLALVLVLSACTSGQHPAVSGNPDLLEFPGVSWGSGKDTVLSALGIADNQILADEEVGVTSGRYRMWTVAVSGMDCFGFATQHMVFRFYDYSGAGFGLGAGLLWALAYPGGYGSRVFLLSLAGLECGALCQYVLSQSLAGCMLCAAGVVALLDLQQILRQLLADLADLPALLQVAVPEFLLSLLWTPVIYLLFRAIYRRVGGTKLA